MLWKFGRNTNSGVPITTEGWKTVGILTNRDLRFARFDIPISK